MKKWIAFTISCIMIFSLAACGNAENNQNTSTDADSAIDGETAADTAAETITETTTATTADTVSGETEAQPPESETSIEAGKGQDTDSAGSNILVAYFSLAGEQYNVGVIEEGNTSIIAHMIAEQTGADLFEIEAVTPYSETHSELLDVSRQEMADNARPEIAGTVDNMADYDTVFIGYPNWWGDMPMIVYNFMESYDFSGKTIVPFCTHGGSGLSGTERTIAGICPDALMTDGFAISGETAQNDREASLERVSEWLKECGFIE